MKYRRNADNKLDFINTLNGSGLATPRLLVCLLETYQNKDGSITIPDILSSYLNISKIQSK
jgi:seryl-tRNA synthetase